MNDKPVIIGGLAVFVAAVAFPVWYAAATGGAGPRPELELPAGESNCVEDKAYMTANHMKLLYQWRNSVVREGRRTYLSSSGRRFTISLSNTCLKCHAKKAGFCDRCHDYVSVKPRCWNCHVDPNKGLQEIRQWSTAGGIFSR